MKENTTAIMKALPKVTNVATDKKKDLLKDKAISLSASTKEELLQKLKNKDYTVSEGDYRLVIFNPSDEKINKAKLLIEKDKPWKGRMDIWFSNHPLLKEGGKTVFLFAGFDSGTEIEIQSVSDYFDIPYKQVVIGKNELMGHSINHFYRSKLLDAALKKMGLTPDMNAGHSVGEWHALSAGGYVTPDSIEEMIIAYDPEKQTNTNVFYIAVGCGYDRIKSWCEAIPELYLANDNCQNQILMAGKAEARDMLIEQLKKEQIYYQVLSYQSGYHTPLFHEGTAEWMATHLLSSLVMQKYHTPVWSATTLEVYPNTVEGQYELGMKHLSETVRFRELIEKLHGQEQVKVFVQIGFGSVLSFVEDTLKSKPFSAISTIVPSLSGIEQLRRIAALFFIEGKTINKELIGIKEKQEESNDPILRAVNNNLREIATLQEEVLKWYKIKKSKTPSPARTDSRKTGNKIEKTLKITLDEHPYLVSHTVVRQPENYQKELKPVAPFAMTLELLCESAMELAPGKKALKITSAGALKWIPVTAAEPFIANMQGVWKSEDCLSWTIPEHAFGNITLGDAFPPVPDEYVGKIDLGDENIISQMPDKKKIYAYFLFHGPQYQSVIELVRITKKGLQASIRKTEGKASMLDSLGQLLGVYCHLALDKDQTTFPMSVEEIQFYQDIQDQNGVFEYTLVVREIKADEVIGDMVIKRDNKVWCIVKGWHNHRFDHEKELMNVVICPEEFIAAGHLENNIYYYNVIKKATSLDFLYERYLNSKEKKRYDSLYLNKAREYLFRCITVKDAVRKYLQKNEDEPLLYPIEISVEHDSNGKPYVCGREELKGIEISIAHKNAEIVVIVAGKPVGIDIEKIEDRAQGFMDIAFTEQELAFLKTKSGDKAEWVTRFWVAKEAYGKMLGLGLQGNPKQYEVVAVDEETLKIKNTFIKTVKHKETYIVGWTANT